MKDIIRKSFLTLFVLIGFGVYYLFPIIIGTALVIVFFMGLGVVSTFLEQHILVTFAILAIEVGFAFYSFYKEA